MPSRDGLPGTDESVDLEQDALALLRNVGLSPRDLTLSRDDQSRVDLAARETLRDLLSESKKQQRPSVGSRRYASWWAAAVVAVIAGLILTWTRPDAPSRQTDPVDPLTIHYVIAGGLQQSAQPETSKSLYRLAALAERDRARSIGAVQRVRRIEWRIGDDATVRGKTPNPIETDTYVLPGGEVRSVDRRLPPLDSRGNVDEPEDLGKGAVVGAEALKRLVDGPDYPARLSVDSRRLTRELVPDQATCAARVPCLVARIEHLQCLYVVPPQVTAAMWRSLAATKGLSDLGRVRDRIGRWAVAFATRPDTLGRQHVIYISPTSGSFLGADVVAVRNGDLPGAHVPYLVSFTALIDAERIPRVDLP